MTTTQHRDSGPKGKPTPARNADRRGIDKANRRATLQWIAVFAVIAIVLVAVAVFGPSGSGGVPIRNHGG